MNKTFFKIYLHTFDNHQTHQIQQILFLYDKTFQAAGHEHQASIYHCHLKFQQDLASG